MMPLNWLSPGFKLRQLQMSEFSFSLFRQT
uniref:Uncharacterized protein n=1 Tax=Arundo donax TaxID=35708 RepID=A0A0A9A7P8_ARUDO